MELKLRERFERLGPIRVVDRVASGFAAVVVLRLQPPGITRPIDAIFALARRGMTMLQAKRAVETLIETGRVFVDLPTVESIDAVAEDLARAGIASARIDGSARLMSAPSERAYAPTLEMAVPPK